MTLLSSVTAGILLGLSAGFAPGPLLALVITHSLRHDSKEGIKVAMAPLITDMPIIAASLLVLTRLSHVHSVLGAISLAGGVYVLYLAYESVKAGPVQVDVSCMQAHSIRKGVLINVLNPHPYLFWITVGAPFMIQSWQKGRVLPFLFGASFYTLLVGSKVFLALVAGRSKSLLAGRGYTWVMRGLGGFLAVFAVVLMKDALALWGIVPP